MGLIAKLSGRVLSHEDVDHLFESILASFEQKAPDGPDVRVAREVVDEMAAMLVRTRKPQE